MTVYRFFSVKNVQATTPIHLRHLNSTVNYSSDARILLSQ